MKKIAFFVMLATLLFAGCGNRKFEKNAVFSVSPTMQVRFSKGNLEYDGSYRFAAHQYDYGSYFCWGTGSNPMLTSDDNDDYPTFDDWGSHIDGGWRTLTSDEWQYVLHDRPNASDKFGAATVCDVYGMVLLPDSWNGGTFNAGLDNGWSTNVYDASSWAAMEDAGAVFLPAKDLELLIGDDIVDRDVIGAYWSSTPITKDWAYMMYKDWAYMMYLMLWEIDGFDMVGEERCAPGFVRLVQNIGSGKGTSGEVSRKGTSREVSVKRTSREVSVKRATGDGLFSVSAGRKVRFAPGNLDYNGGYFFTTHQYDYGGLFGWGTGSNPTLTSTYYRDYLTFDDWGNHIAGGWRTLSWDEWLYVIWSRADASAKRGAATVCGVHGMVLLPDNFSGGTFHAGFNGWSTNVYDASSWSDMEAAGAVFLPAAGWRDGTELRYVGTFGYYWSSTSYSGDGGDAANSIRFDEDIVSYAGFSYRCGGISVRLVQDY